MAEQLGRYVSERVLGSGAFATVWLARDDGLDDWVAIKVLAENWAHDDEIRTRFVEEARILRRIDSPNIVPVHDVGELPDGRPYMVMAFADRGTLDLRLHQLAAGGQRVEVSQALDWSLQIAEALDAAHHAGIANRD